MSTIVDIIFHIGLSTILKIINMKILEYLYSLQFGIKF